MAERRAPGVLDTSVAIDLAFDAPAARRYGALVAIVVAQGRAARPRRVDLMIAASAAAHGLPLYTRNPRAFAGLEGEVEIVAM